MSINPYLYALWQKLSFQILHKNAVWVLLLLLLTAICAWHLATILDKHNAREREAKLARNTAIGYIISALTLWTLSFIR